MDKLLVTVWTIHYAQVVNCFEMAFRSDRVITHRCLYLAVIKWNLIVTYTVYSHTNVQWKLNHLPFFLLTFRKHLNENSV